MWHGILKASCVLNNSKHESYKEVGISVITLGSQQRLQLPIRFCDDLRNRITHRQLPVNFNTKLSEHTPDRVGRRQHVASLFRDIERGLIASASRMQYALAVYQTLLDVFVFRLRTEDTDPTEVVGENDLSKRCFLDPQSRVLIKKFHKSGLSTVPV